MTRASLTSYGKVSTISQTYAMLWRTSSLLHETSLTLLIPIAQTQGLKGDSDMGIHDFIDSMPLLWCGMYKIHVANGSSNYVPL